MLLTSFLRKRITENKNRKRYIIVLRTNYKTKPLKKMHCFPLFTQVVRLFKNELFKKRSQVWKNQLIPEKSDSSVNLTYTFELCHHEKRKTWQNEGMSKIQKNIVFFVEIFQNKKGEVWKKIIGKISPKTSDSNEKMQFAVLTGYCEILNQGKKYLLQNFCKNSSGGNARHCGWTNLSTHFG